jgi:hypothetical protein
VCEPKTALKNKVYSFQNFKKVTGTKATKAGERGLSREAALHLDVCFVVHCQRGAIETCDYLQTAFASVAGFLLTGSEHLATVTFLLMTPESGV